MDDDLGRMTREELVAHVKNLRRGPARTWQAFEDRARVARVWQGRTREARAETYARYLYEEGVKKLRATSGNLGVQVFREVRDGVAHFTTISYWASREDIKAYAGADIEKPHHLPQDAEYLLELPRHVRHFDILVNERGN